MPPKARTFYSEKVRYIGIQTTTAFYLRVQAMMELRGGDKRMIIGEAILAEQLKWEKKLDTRSGQAFDALLEAKARQNNLSVDEIKNSDAMKPPIGDPKKASRGFWREQNPLEKTNTRPQAKKY